MVDFHHTRAGQRFYEGTMPNIMRNLEKIAIELKRIADRRSAPTKLELMIDEWEKNSKDIG